jgi:hypothetical protein
VEKAIGHDAARLTYQHLRVKAGAAAELHQLASRPFSAAPRSRTIDRVIGPISKSTTFCATVDQK